MNNKTPAGEWLRDGSMLYKLNGYENNCDEINVTMANGSRNPLARADAAARLMTLIEADRALRQSDARAATPCSTCATWLANGAADQPCSSCGINATQKGGA